MDSLKCNQCGGEMQKGTKSSSSLALQLLGVVLFLVGLVLLVIVPPIGTVIGIVVMIASLRLGYSSKKVWKCSGCGYFFERA